MARLLKCYGVKCLEDNKKYPKNELTTYKGKNYCEECLKVIKERDKDYDELCKYICKIFNCPYVNPYVKSQISQFEKGGFSLKGIRSTLKYIVEILGISLQERYGIAMVKYRYYEAKKFAEERSKQYKQVEEQEVQKKPNEVRYVKIEDYRSNHPKKKFSLDNLKK